MPVPLDWADAWHWGLRVLGVGRPLTGAGSAWEWRAWPLEVCGCRHHSLGEGGVTRRALHLCSLTLCVSPSPLVSCFSLVPGRAQDGVRCVSPLGCLPALRHIFMLPLSLFNGFLQIGLSLTPPFAFASSLAETAVRSHLRC